MNVAPRCYHAPRAWDAGTWMLGREESHHLHHVLRLAPGARVILFDGQGRDMPAAVRHRSHQGVEIEPLDAPMRHAPPRPRVSLRVGLLKARGMDWLVEKATELGVAHIAPLITDHTVVRPDNRQAARQLDRWQKTALNACRQCGNPWLPDIRAAQPFEAVVAGIGASAAWGAFLQGQPPPLLAALQAAPPAERTLVFIGPEGDFSAPERARLAEAGVQAVSLGPRVLRAETAALAALSTIMAHAQAHDSIHA